MKIHRLTQFVLLVVALVTACPASAQTSWKGTTVASFRAGATLEPFASAKLDSAIE